jgi:hypothetical protein
VTIPGYSKNNYSLATVNVEAARSYKLLVENYQLTWHIQKNIIFNNSFRED